MTTDLKVTRIDDKFQFSISELATAFSMSRDTVRKRLIKAGIESSGVRGKHPIYHISTASEAIARGAAKKLDVDYDPETLPPKDRLDWFKSESEKDKLLLSRNELITVDDNRKIIADILKMFIQPLETIGDKMEREGVLDVAALEKFESIIDEVRTNIAEEMALYELHEPSNDNP